MTNLPSQKHPSSGQIAIFADMQVNEALIENLSNLARLEFSDSEKPAIRNDLQRMISFVEKLREVDTADTEPLLHMGHALSVYREDVVKNGLDKTTALQNAPGASDNYFKVPKVIKK